MSKPKLDDGLTPLHFAASNNDVRFIDYVLNDLYQNNAQQIVNIENSHGWTPAHFASYLNKFDSLNLLIENGADLARRNGNGFSCFDEVIRQDHASLFECLWPYAKKVKRNLSDVST